MPLLLPTTTRFLGLTSALATSALFYHHQYSPSSPSRLLCESPLSSTTGRGGGSFRTSTEHNAPVKQKINPNILKQLSSGSLLGLLGGVAVSTFSKTLAILFGLLVSGIQFAASQGWNVIPTARIQKYVKGINLRSALEDNPAFKLSFGLTFMLAAFVRF